MFSEVIYNFSRFFHSLFIEMGAQDIFPGSRMQEFLDALLRQEQGQRRVGLYFLLQKLNYSLFGLIHIASGLPIAVQLEKEKGPTLVGPPIQLTAGACLKCVREAAG